MTKTEEKISYIVPYILQKLYAFYILIRALLYFKTFSLVQLNNHVDIQKPFVQYRQRFVLQLYTHTHTHVQHVL